jgi:hypothetical protein
MARHGSRVARTGHSFRRLRPAGLNPMQAAVVALCAVVLCPGLVPQNPGEKLSRFVLRRKGAARRWQAWWNNMWFVDTVSRSVGFSYKPTSPPEQTVTVTP